MSRSHSFSSSASFRGTSSAAIVADEVTVAGAPKLVEASVAAGRKFDGGVVRGRFRFSGCFGGISSEVGTGGKLNKIFFLPRWMRIFFQIQHVGWQKNFISNALASNALDGKNFCIQRLDASIQPLDEKMFFMFSTFYRWMVGWQHFPSNGPTAKYAMPSKQQQTPARRIHTPHRSREERGGRREDHDWKVRSGAMFVASATASS